MVSSCWSLTGLIQFEVSNGHPRLIKLYCMYYCKNSWVTRLYTVIGLEWCMDWTSALCGLYTGLTLSIRRSKNAMFLTLNPYTVGECKHRPVNAHKLKFLRGTGSIGK